MQTERVYKVRSPLVEDMTMSQPIRMLYTVNLQFKKKPMYVCIDKKF